MYDFQLEIEKLDTMEIEDLDNIVNFADNMATQLAIQTSAKIKKLGSSKIKNINERRKKLADDYKKKKEVLEKYIQSAPFTRFQDKLTFIFGVL